MNSNYSPLPIYESDFEQHQNFRWQAFGKSAMLIEEVNRLPVFFIWREDGLANPLTFTLRKLEDDSTTDITTDVTNTGLVIHDEGDYDIISYASTLELPGSYDTGGYQIEVTDGTNMWVSERFVWVGTTHDMVKVEFWHLEDVPVNDKVIKYQAPYKGRLWFDTSIAKPRYPVVKDQIERLTKQYTKSVVSYKRHAFHILVSEEVADVVRLLAGHHKVVVTWQGKEFDCSEFDWEPEWREVGDLVKGSCVFRTKSDTVVFRGTTLNDTSYQPEPGSCVTTDYICSALIDQASNDFTNGTYTDGDGQQQTFSAGSYAMVESGSNLRVYQWNGSSFDLVVHAIDAVAFVGVVNLYYVGNAAATFRIPSIGGVTYLTVPPTIYGTGIPGATHQIFAVTGLEETFLGETTYAQLDLGYQVEIPSGSDKLRMKLVSGPCGLFYTAEDYTLPAPGATGIGAMVIETDFIVS